MIGLRVGSLVVGINDYKDELYQNSEYRLRFAESDAQAFHDYVIRAWPDSPKENHQILSGERADQLNIRTTIERLARRGPYELFFFYFAGHGDKDAQGGGWFCTVNAKPGSVDLGAEALDELFSLIPSSIAILFLDCCYSESILCGSRYFEKLDGTKARLFISSARGDQRTWEEETLSHGIFSYLLLKALATDSPVANGNSSVNVDTAVFPYLCEQVPLFTFKHKNGQRQEPVKGGVSSSAVLLPLANTSSVKPDLSIYEVVRARYRQALMITASAILLAVCAIQVFLYHLAIGPNGNLVVRNGLRETFSLLPRWFGTRVETDFDENSFSPRNLESIAKLQNGQIWGVWTQSGKNGWRSWMASVIPSLKEDQRERTILEISGVLSPEFLAEIKKMDAAEDMYSWQANLVADSLLLQPQKDNEISACLLRHMPKVEEVIRCDVPTPPVNILDFGILQLPSSEIIGHLEALNSYVQSGGKIDFSEFEKALRLVSYRALFEKENDKTITNTPGEVSALGNLLYRIGMSRKAAGLTALSADEMGYLEKLNKSWCAIPAMAALAHMGGLIDQTSTLQNLQMALKTIGVNEPSLKRWLILQSIEVLAADNQLNDAVVDLISKSVRQENGALGGDDQILDVLGRVSNHHALPADFKAFLLQQFISPTNDSDYDQLSALRILAANYNYLSDAERRTLLEWVEKLHSKNKGVSLLAQVYGNLGINGFTNEEILSYLDGRIRPDLKGRRRLDTSRPEFYMTITASDNEDSVALGRIAQKNRLPERIRDRLYQYAINRPEVPNQEEIFKGLAVQRSLVADSKNIANIIRSQIYGASEEYQRRRVEEAISVEVLLMLPFKDRAEALIELSRIWENENEPEVRIALARVIVKTKKEADGDLLLKEE